MTSPQSSTRHAIEQHPDVKALGARFDQIAPTTAVRALHGLTFLAGVYAAISAWVVGFHAQTSLTVNNLIVGAAAALAAFAIPAAYERMRDLSWAAAACGIWLIIAPWAVQGVDRTTGMVVSNVIVGAVIALFALAAAAMELVHYRRSRT